MRCSLLSFPDWSGGRAKEVMCSEILGSHGARGCKASFSTLGRSERDHPS